MRDENKERPMISVIVPLYNTEKYIERCLRSICGQTYGNLEILVVDDGSTDGSVDLVKKMAGQDPRIRILTHEDNRGLYRARLTGVSAARGDYIGFVDSDDYISCDRFRTMLDKALREKADIVIGPMVQEDEKGYRYIQNLYHFYEYGILEGKEITETFWRQEGRCFVWHTVWNKLYARELWQEALPVLNRQQEHLVMTEDFAFSCVLFGLAHRLAAADYGCYYYFQHGDASTGLKGGYEKYEANIRDLETAFRFVDEKVLTDTYRCRVREHFVRWRDLYRFFWMENIDRSGLKDSEKDRLRAQLARALPEGGSQIREPSYFYGVSTAYDDRYDRIAEQIASPQIRCVSFDIFDTALLRPLYRPTDLFCLLDPEFARSALEEKRPFSKLRTEAERELRKEKIYDSPQPAEDVTFEEIYDRLADLTTAGAQALKRIKEREQETEAGLCRARKSVLNLYREALCCGKKICFTSDMYYDRDFLEGLLRKAGYETCDWLFVSSQEHAAKRTGKLYRLVREKTGLAPKEILHLGDNWESDAVRAGEAGFVSVFYPSPLDCLQYNIPDIPTTHSCCAYTEPSGYFTNYEKGISYLGTRSALAAAANRLYDNPFISYHPQSEMNACPEFLGYYAVGMHLLGFAKWFTEKALEEKYDALVFVARDGYLPMKAYEILRKYYPDPPRASYLYTSRKAAMACGISGKEDLPGLFDAIVPERCTPDDLAGMLAPILKGYDRETFVKKGYRMNVPFGEYGGFSDFVRALAEQCFDREKNESYQNAVAAYFKERIPDRSACVDVGYSGRTQQLIKTVTHTAVDAFYIHTNDETCRIRQKQSGFRIHSFYEHTPAVTGGVRELIFSQYGPSCIGYEVTGEKTGPRFETFCREVFQRHAIEQIQRQALAFVRDFTDVFGPYIGLMEMRNEEISYPYEYYLHTLTDADAKVFAGCSFEDQLWAGGTFSLTDYWKESIRYHRIVPWYRQQDPAAVSADITRRAEDANLAYDFYVKSGMENKSLIQKALYWLAVDREFFSERLKDHMKNK